MSYTAQQVTQFWFTELQPKDWFKGEGIDEIVTSRFGPLIQAIYDGRHDDWLSSPQGRLAAILVLDQFTRNVYRGRPESFAFDDRAREFCKQGITLGHDEQLSPIQRVFFYLPLEHSESMVDQDLSLERFARLVVSVGGEEAENFRGYLHYAWRHYEIIKRFGRYPHRNDILGRASTQKEVDFLQTPGSSF